LEQRRRFHLRRYGNQLLGVDFSHGRVNDAGELSCSAGEVRAIDAVDHSHDRPKTGRSWLLRKSSPF
jgi:hypothetical protein